MGFVGGPTEDKRYGVEPACVDHLALIVSPTPWLARQREVHAKDLENWPCIAAERISGRWQFVERKSREAGVTLRVAMELLEPKPSRKPSKPTSASPLSSDSGRPVR